MSLKLPVVSVGLLKSVLLRLLSRVKNPAGGSRPLLLVTTNRPVWHTEPIVLLGSIREVLLKTMILNCWDGSRNRSIDRGSTTNMGPTCAAMLYAVRMSLSTGRRPCPPLVRVTRIPDRLVPDAGWIAPVLLITLVIAAVIRVSLNLRNLVIRVLWAPEFVP